MRTLFLLLISTAHCQAALVWERSDFIDGYGCRGCNDEINRFNSYMGRVGFREALNIPVARWTLQITPADAGRTWTLDRYSAAGYGVDWPALVDWTATRQQEQVFEWGLNIWPGGNNFHYSIRNVSNLPAHDTSHITFTVDSFLHEATERFGQPLWWNEVQVTARIFSVPEPASIVLVVLACLCHPYRRLNGRVFTVRQQDAV